MREYCQAEAENVRKAITKELRGKMVSLKVDSCSGGQRPFFGINALFDAKGALQIRTLKVKEMATTQQVATNLKKEIRDTAFGFEIPSGNIYTLTSDTGGNMILAAKQLGEDQEEEQTDILEREESMDDGCLLAAGDHIDASACGARHTPCSWPFTTV